MLRRLSILLAILLTCTVAGLARAQSVLTLRPVPESRLEVDGTSNKSAWTVEAKQLSGRFTIEAGDSALLVSAAEVHVPSNSMKSSRGIIMDRLMKGALKVSEFGDISFVMKEPSSAQADGEAWELSAPGMLTIAGQTREVVLQVRAETTPEGLWRFTGAHTVAMTDYGMRPPTAMFGALVTGDEVMIRFDVLAGAD